MNQLHALFNRLLIVFTISVCTAFVCTAQTPVNNNGQSTEKAAVPNKDKSTTASALDEELSKTPAGKTVAKFFTAFNSGDVKLMRGFHESYGGDTENADKDMEFFERTGGLKLHSLTHPAKDKIAVLAQTKKDARWITFEFTLDTEEPHSINSINVRPAAAPLQTSH